ncbi:hypothetical protein L1987_40032 [Smallanthus sonchifolius]|uniref:Uncharacterized protein n=1 Tax=Smallanthus sonchifolius TaxID=185202 RepID=A0ACB9GSC3_9ASTR|nr:hypothetical protein L1987_40032 [Smallanthus sonchifolius]
MVKKMTRSSSSSDDLVSKNLLANPDCGKCTFSNHEINILKSGGCFPISTVFRAFDPKTRSDFTSGSWVCFPSFPFTIGFSYPFPAFTTEFFEKTVLAPPTPDTAKRIAFFYRLEPIERTFKFKTPPLRSVRKSSSKFALDDIDIMVSKGKTIKRKTSQLALPAPKPEVPKPESSTPRSKLPVKKKRKPADAAEVAIFECRDYADAHKKLHALGHLALEQITKFHESVAKEAEEGKQMICNLQKIATTKNKKLADVTKELSRVKAELQDAYAQHAQDLDESHEQAKTSATISKFQARIKMAKEADDKDFERANWDVQEWKRLVAKLGGEPV